MGGLAPRRHADDTAGSQLGRTAFLDDLYLVLKDRADRRESRPDRRLLDRGDGYGRRTIRPADVSAQVEAAALGSDAKRYLLVAFAMTLVFMAMLAIANYCLAPQLFRRAYVAHVADQLVAGFNYGLFDLNFDIRGFRHEHIKHLPEKPEVVVLGASHWQEAHAGLVPHRRFYNAHVHRDYYEDLLAVVEMLIRYDRLPNTLILSIRDMSFASVESRTDSLWFTGLSDYRAMAARLGIRSHSRIETGEWSRWLGLVSLPTAWDNAKRWVTAVVHPGPTREDLSATLDLLMEDGSIRWSGQHRAQFTAERRDREVEAAAAERRDLAPPIDAQAVAAVDRLLDLLNERGVRVVLAHPPFNPEFYRAIQNSPYLEHLGRVRAVTEQLAKTHDAFVVGAFDPAKVGCKAAMYIDAEHSGPGCLQLVLNQIRDL